ncbi:F-box domain-containing protein [Mycena venus]|uniref:F-box domain-containing protein n=1 Tax=Mycena venus TaxID=2733690 RepID=A0A8H6X6X2_9AGAR|nr:F-box domain-containing protein [Mycena venus]
MPRPNLQHLRDRLAHLNSQIPLLEAERKAIRKTLSAVFYPVLDLPSEVTSEIFLHCLPDAPSVPSSITAPLLLLKICRRWRDVALKTPALWASFAVHGGSGRTFGSLGTDHLSRWLQRAGAALLNLSLVYRGRGSSSFPEAFFQIFGHASQWRRVHFVVPFGCFSHPRVQAALRGNVTSLEELSLDANAPGNTMDWRYVSDIGPLTLFAKAPKLRMVSLISLPLSCVSLPWAQLTSLTAQSFDLEEALNVLDLCPILAYYRLGYPAEAGRVSRRTFSLFPLPPLPHLKSLLLEYQPHDQLLRYLTLPNLTTLSLPPHTYDAYSFFSRLSPNGLRKLHLRQETHPGDILRDALEFSPALSDIELDVCPSDVADIMHLISASPATSHLQSIRMDVKGDPESLYEYDSLNYTALLRALVILKKKALCSCHITFAIPDSFEFQVYDYSDDGSDREAAWSRHKKRYISAIRPNASDVKKLSELRNEGFCISIGSTQERWI